jgi:hypothetical protein
MANTTIRLTAGQISALECSGVLELDEFDGPEMVVLAEAWQGRRLVVTEATRDALFTALTDRSNAEDATAQHGPAELRQAAAGASLALANLSTKVLRAEVR